MKERVEALVGRRARVMWVSTFHSACVRILRKEIDKFGYKSNFSIYDAADSKRLMTMVAKDLDLDPKRHQPNALLNWMSDHKNELRDAEEATRDARNGFEESARGRLHDLPEAAARGQRPRLRRPDHDHGPPLPGVPRRTGELPPPVPPRPRRRVPGHQPRPVRPGPPALCRRPRGPRPRGRAGRAQRADGGRRRRPVDLRLPRRQHPQHPRLRAGLPRRRDDPAGAELPLHPDHPQRRQRGHRPQPGPQAQAAVVRRRRPASGSSATSPTTSTTRPASSPRRSTGWSTRPTSAPPTWRSSTAPTPSRACSRRCSSAPASPTRSSAGCASTSGARCATRSPTCGCWSTRPTRSRCAGCSTPPSAGSATARSPA